MYGEELRYMSEAFEMNWDVHRGENINEAERMTRAFQDLCKLKKLI